MRIWYPWGDETLIYACDDTDGHGMFLFWADLWMDSGDEYWGFMFGVENGYVRRFADADDIVIDSLEAAEEYLLEEGMTDFNVLHGLDGIFTEIGPKADYDAVKAAIEEWFVENSATDYIA